MINEQEIEAWAKSNLPIYEYMGLEVTSVSDGIYSCFLPLNPNTGNHIGTVHAAFQFAAAEILGGLVVLTKRTDTRYVPVVKSLNIEFIRPALSGIRSEARFSDEQVEAMNLALESTGRYDFDLNSVIRNAQGDVVAEDTGCYSVRTME